MIFLFEAVKYSRDLDKQKFNVYFIHLYFKEWTYTDEQGNVYNIDKNDFSLPLRIIVFTSIVYS